MRVSLCATLLVSTTHAMVTTTPGVLNLRPVSPSLPGIFRSGELDRASDADAAHLLDSLRIRTLIDLRSQDEIDKAAASGSPVGRALMAAFRDGAPVGPGQLASEGSGQLRRYHVPLLADIEGFWSELGSRLGPARKAEAAIYRTVDARRYDQLLYDELARQKHELLYTVMLRSAGTDAWGRALRLASDTSGGNVLIHCAKGKDRTGVLSALLQHAVGDCEADIVAAYAASAELLNEPEPSGSPAPRGAVDWTPLRGSPAPAMSATLAWVRREYGTLDGYLDSVGAGEAWASELRWLSKR